MNLFRTVFPINALPAAQLVSEGIDALSHSGGIKLKAVQRYYEQVDADLLFCFSDIAIQAEAMGAQVFFSPDSMPAVSRPGATLTRVDVRKNPRMRVNAEVIRGLKRTYPARPVAAMVYGPFTVAGQVAGEQQVLRAVVKNPDEVHNLTGKSLCLRPRLCRPAPCCRRFGTLGFRPACLPAAAEYVLGVCRSLSKPVFSKNTKGLPPCISVAIPPGL